MGIELAKTNMYIVQGLSAGILLAKTNMYIAQGLVPGILLAKTNMYIADNGQPEAPTAEYRIPKASVEAVASGPSARIEGTKAGVQAAALSLTAQIQATSANLTLPVVQEKTFQVTKAAVQVVCRGRPELAYVRAWTFTLDGHEYYVLQLQEMTLVYDIQMKQWYNWGSVDRDLWRAQIGIDWNANVGKIIGGSLGATNIIVGDYALGSLYFLNTALNEDTGPEGDGFLPFKRDLYAQAAVRGHDYVPCNGIELSGSIGETSGATVTSVTLEYSDDSGHTYVNAGAIDVTPGQYSFVLQWPSLGSFKGPGRLFRVTDWGVLARVDGIDMNDGTDNG